MKPPKLTWVNHPLPRTWGTERRADWRGHYMRVWEDPFISGRWGWSIRWDGRVIAAGHEDAMHRAKATAVAVAVHRWTR